MYSMNIETFIFLLLIFSKIFLCAARNGTGKGNTARLLKDLFADYDKTIRPLADDGEPVIVHGTLLGAILIQVEENKQVASYVATRRQRWTDPRLSWDPEKYGGIQDIVVSSGIIWKSDIFVYNSVSFENLLAEPKDWALIDHTGEIIVNFPQYIETTCKIMVYRFPFDTQFCALSLSSNQLTSKQMIWTPVPIEYSNKRFAGNSEWTLENVTITYQQQDSVGVWGSKGVYAFKYVFQLKRRPTYYVTVIVIPTFLITAVSIVGVFAPGTDHEPGDVANLGLGTLLALMVLLGIISDRLPKSEEMPLLGYHILMILVMFVLCVLLEMGSLFVFQKLSNSGKRPPEWLYKITGFRLITKKKTPVREPWKNGLENGSAVKIPLDNNDTASNGSETSMQNQKRKKNLMKRVTSKENSKGNFDQWKHIIREIGKKSEDEKQKIKQEWDKIETRLDFLWIVIFESFNILNICSLLYFANLSTPNMHEWIDGT